jgi:hypothetical protein
MANKPPNRSKLCILYSVFNYLNVSKSTQASSKGRLVLSSALRDGNRIRHTEEADHREHFISLIYQLLDNEAKLDREASIRFRQELAQVELMLSSGVTDIAKKYGDNLAIVNARALFCSKPSLS